jgi:ComF family protein
VRSAVARPELGSHTRWQPARLPARAQPPATLADTLAMTMTGFVTRALDLLYPPRCPACDVFTEPESALCTTCEISLYPVDAACVRCGDPMAPGAGPVQCRRCWRRPPPFLSLAAPYLYGGQLAVAVQRLKYGRRPDIARTLAPLLGPALERWATDADLLVPVPLHWRRQARRGFNQAGLLLDEARRRHAPQRRVPVDVVSLRRIRATLAQAGLSAPDRERNLARAFAVQPRRRSRVQGQRILLVDDIATTGATMAAAARALLDAGAREVRGLCLARADS